METKKIDWHRIFFNLVTGYKRKNERQVIIERDYFNFCSNILNDETIKPRQKFKILKFIDNYTRFAGTYNLGSNLKNYNFLRCYLLNKNPSKYREFNEFVSEEDKDLFSRIINSNVDFLRPNVLPSLEMMSKLEKEILREKEK